MSEKMKTIDEIHAEDAGKIRAAGATTEAEMREAKIPAFATVEELSAFINGLVERPHDYGTCVYAMSHAAVAAFNFVAHKLGVTGFQAVCADFDILRHTRSFKWGKLLNYENLLYPQYCNDEHFPSWQQVINDPENIEAFAQKAKEILARGSEHMADEVRAHLEMLAARKPAS